MVRALIIVAAAFVAGCQSYHDGSGKTVGEVTDDRAIHARIKYALWDDEELSGWSINVDVELGAVALYGPGLSQAAMARAGRIVSAIKGVRTVNNALTVVTD
jgi:osmotically-inducible protein OsmY